MWTRRKTRGKSARFLTVVKGVRILSFSFISDVSVSVPDICHCVVEINQWVSWSFLLVFDYVLILAMLQEAKISFPSHSAGCDQEESHDWG